MGVVATSRRLGTQQHVSTGFQVQLTAYSGRQDKSPALADGDRACLSVGHAVSVPRLRRDPHSSAASRSQQPPGSGDVTSFRFLVESSGPRVQHLRSRSSSKAVAIIARHRHFPSARSRALCAPRRRAVSSRKRRRPRPLLWRVADPERQSAGPLSGQRASLLLGEQSAVLESEAGRPSRRVRRTARDLRVMLGPGLVFSDGCTRHAPSDPHRFGPPDWRGACPGWDWWRSPARSGDAPALPLPGRQARHEERLLDRSCRRTRCQATD
jgi:hypothetical protein